jgi:hypothetical protein
VGNGDVSVVGDQKGPFITDMGGILTFRINDIDASLGDNDGQITIGVLVKQSPK